MPPAPWLSPAAPLHTRGKAGFCTDLLRSLLGALSDMSTTVSLCSADSREQLLATDRLSGAGPSLRWESARGLGQRKCPSARWRTVPGEHHAAWECDCGLSWAICRSGRGPPSGERPRGSLGFRRQRGGPDKSLLVLEVWSIGSSLTRRYLSATGHTLGDRIRRFPQSWLSG